MCDKTFCLKRLFQLNPSTPKTTRNKQLIKDGLNEPNTDNLTKKAC